MFSRGRGGRSDLGDRDARNRGTWGEHSWRAVLWHADEDGSASMSTKHERATELLGLIPYDGPPLTLEDMDEAIAEGATSS